jgi:mono/diheme cytochrome c family protein
MLATVARAADARRDEPLDGAALYATHCSLCHGRFGEGDGILAPSLAVVLQDLRYLSRRNNGEFPRDFIVNIIDGRAVRAAHGPEGMPVWGAEFARGKPIGEQTEQAIESHIQALAQFLESIQIAT